MRRARKGWYHGWNIVIICMIAQMAGLAVAINSMTFFTEDWSREFGMPMSSILTVVPIFSTVACLVMPLVGMALARYPVRLILACAVGLMIFAHAAMGFVTTGWQIIALYAVVLPVAVSFAGATPAQTLVARWFVRRRGFAFSLSALGLVIAGVVFPPLVVLGNSFIGWRGTWLVYAFALLLFVLPAVLLIVRERPDPSERHLYMGEETATPGEPVPLSVILRRRNFWILVVVHGLVILPNSAILSNFAPFVTSGGMTTAQAASLLALFNLAAVVGKIFTGVFIDRYGTKPLLMATPLTAALSTFGLTIGHGFPTLAAGVFLLGATQGVWVLVAACTAEEYDSVSFPRAYATMSAFTAISSFSGPLLAYARETSGSYVPGMMVLAACAATGVLIGSLYNVRRPA